MAYCDPLTRLPNLGLLQDQLDLALAASVRSGLFGALCFINVRNFRGLNSAEGHETGDSLLVQLAARLRSALCDSDLVARQWGNEFLILLEDLGTTAMEATLRAHHRNAFFCRGLRVYDFVLAKCTRSIMHGYSR